MKPLIKENKTNKLKPLDIQSLILAPQELSAFFFASALMLQKESKNNLQ